MTAQIACKGRCGPHVSRVAFDTIAHGQSTMLEPGKAQALSFPSRRGRVLFEPKDLMMPAWLRNRLRIFAGFAAPLIFAFSTGHFLSSLRRRAQDRTGRPIPWYTYPAIHYLAQFDFSDADILEFGGGQSTLWWQQRARSVTTLESSPAFIDELRRKTASHVTVHRVSSPIESAAMIVGRTFDVIVIDDGSGVGPVGRAANGITAFGHINPGGLIVVDNSDAPPSAPIAAEAAARGWHRIDFIGFAPGSMRQYATSVFFLGPERLKLAAPPRVSPRL